MFFRHMTLTSTLEGNVLGVCVALNYLSTGTYILAENNVLWVQGLLP